MNTSNIERYIEKRIENKINQFFDILPAARNTEVPKMIYEYTISELYENTLQTVLDIINDLTELHSNYAYMSNKEYRLQLMNIVFANDRKLFVGIVLILLAIILYFIDGASI
jgi:hypothetical protein